MYNMTTWTTLLGAALLLLLGQEAFAQLAFDLCDDQVACSEVAANELLFNCRFAGAQGRGLCVSYHTISLLHCR